MLHNWRREAERFTPHLKVLVLESGAARHNLRKQIPQHDIIVTNYALLRRDLEALQKFSFSAVILDEAQFIKNPARAGHAVGEATEIRPAPGPHRHAAGKSPARSLEHRGFHPARLSRHAGAFPRKPTSRSGEGDATGRTAQRIARRRLSAKLRPLMLRRLKKQVAKDLPDRIEERRDCELGEAQRKLYLAELRRSREQVMQTVAEKGLNKSKMHVLAALTRLRQICCHPQLVGNDSPSGKTETLFELLEPLLAEGQKVLIFSPVRADAEAARSRVQNAADSDAHLTGETKERQTIVQNFAISWRSLGLVLRAGTLLREERHPQPSAAIADQDQGRPSAVPELPLEGQPRCAGGPEQPGRPDRPVPLPQPAGRRVMSGLRDGACGASQADSSSSGL